MEDLACSMPDRNRLLYVKSVQEMSTMRLKLGKISIMILDLKFRLKHQTVRNMLKKRGMKSAITCKMKKPLLKISTKKERLMFARKYENCTVEDWMETSCIIR